MSEEVSFNIVFYVTNIKIVYKMFTTYFQGKCHIQKTNKKCFKYLPNNRNLRKEKQIMLLSFLELLLFASWQLNEMIPRFFLWIHNFLHFIENFSFLTFPKLFACLFVKYIFDGIFIFKKLSNYENIYHKRFGILLSKEVDSSSWIIFWRGAKHFLQFSKLRCTGKVH